MSRSSDPQADVTEPNALTDRYSAEIYADLARIARAELNRFRRGQTLDTGALVHETYLKMHAKALPDFASRKHFYATAAKAMRQIVIDHARARAAAIRGGGETPVSLDQCEPSQAIIADQAVSLIALHECLEQLASLDPRVVEVLELRFFAGLELPQVAEILGVSAKTVQRDTQLAQAFIARRLKSSDSAG